MTGHRDFRYHGPMSDSDRTITLRGDHITLAQAVKLAGLADTGGQAKMRVREGDLLVNGKPEIQPAKKLRAGDRFGLAGEPEWVIVA